MRVVDFGIRGLDLTYALLDAPDLTILVDAVPRGGTPALSTQSSRTLKISRATANRRSTRTAWTPCRCCGRRKQWAADLGRILLVGCEPGDLGGEEGRMGLTPPVSAAIETAADMVESLIAKELQEV